MKKKAFPWRIISLAILFFVFFIVVLARLFYWQVLASEKLTKLAKNQYLSQKEILPSRGEIFAVDNFPLVTNKKAYLLYSSLPHLEEPLDKLAASLAPFLINEEEIKATVSASGKKKTKEEVRKEEIATKKEFLSERLNSQDLNWVILQHTISEEAKEKIENLNFKGLGFEDEPRRFYPEASMAAHLLGFVGKNEVGSDTGYFGLEGFYDIELKGRGGLVMQETDTVDDPILIGSFSNEEKKDGQSLVLHLDRSVQLIVEEKLRKAVEKYKAKSGSVVMMDAKTGGIIALAVYPSFDPREYFEFDKYLFRNSLISDAYEPGSTFKIFVMAAALDQEVLKPETKCDICQGPLKIDKYEIKTWDEKYHPDSTMTEVIQNSDNLGMVFVSRKLGLDNLWQALKDFGFGEETRIDLEGEIPCFLKAKEKWNEVDSAVAAFGQGIAVSGIQMVRACGALANEGKLMEPHVVKEIISGEKRIQIKPKIVRQVIKPKTAKLITEIMVQAVEKGETKYLKLPGYKVAGKTGTAQIPVAGHYDKEKTIASFIGFAPADKPRFVMLVKLREPEASPWGSETAAPLFFSIAKEILVYYGIQPE
jgi:stage V sporulation protein D (sporulation-specific penicillin-binding protein)